MVACQCPLHTLPSCQQANQYVGTISTQYNKDRYIVSSNVSMGTDSLLSDGQLSPLNQAKDNWIVQRWIATIDTFYDYYIQLCIYANTYYAQESMGLQPTAYVGQCSIDQLERLLVTMQQLLDELLHDVPKLNQAKAQWTAEKLLEHTQLLTQLNQQAQAVCHLAGQPAS